MAQETGSYKFSTSELAICVTLILALVGLVFYFGKQHQKVVHLKDDADKISGLIDQSILPALTDINSGISYIRGAMDKIKIGRVTKNKSPLVLNETGIKILNESGIDKIINDNYLNILEKVKKANPANAYQAQEIIKKLVAELITNPDLKNIIEIGAFSCGSDVETVLFVGAIDIRDKILGELNLFPEDIDTFDPSKTQ